MTTRTDGEAPRTMLPRGISINLRLESGGGESACRLRVELELYLLWC